MLQQYECPNHCNYGFPRQHAQTRIAPASIQTYCRNTPTFQSTAFEDGVVISRRNIQHRPLDHGNQFFYPQGIINAHQKCGITCKKSELEKIRPQSAQKLTKKQQIPNKQSCGVYKNDSAYQRQVFLNPHTHCCNNCSQLGFYKTRNTLSKSQWLDNCKEERWRNLHVCKEHGLSKERKLVDLSSQHLWGDDSRACINAFQHRASLTGTNCGCRHRQTLEHQEPQNCPFHRIQNKSPEKFENNQNNQGQQIVGQQNIINQQSNMKNQNKVLGSQRIEKVEPMEGKIITRSINKSSSQKNIKNQANKNRQTAKKSVPKRGQFGQNNSKKAKSTLYGNSTPLFTVVNNRRY